MATTAKVWRTIYTPWAGGYASGRRVWGKERILPASTIEVPPDIVTQRQPPPPGNCYKVAFMIVAKERSDITVAMIQRVDAVRRYWDAAFDAATEHVRQSDSGALTVSSSSVVFGLVTVSEFATKTVSIRNTGSSDIAVTWAARNTGLFRWAACDEVIAPQQEKVVPIEFHPVAPGLATGQLIVSSDIPLKRAIALRGSGRLAPLVP